MAIFYAFVALCLSGSALAQIITSGNCPIVEMPENYDLSRIGGKWYEQERFFTLYETGGECGLFDFILGAKGEPAKLTHTLTSSMTGKEMVYETDIFFPDPEVPAKMKRHHPRSPVLNDAVVLATDYDNWGVVYSCTEVCGMSLQYVWVVTREQVPDESFLAIANAALQRNNIETSQLMRVEQKTCSM